MEKNDVTNKTLNIDVVGDFEQQVGKKHEEWTEFEKLQFLKQTVMSNQLRAGYLESIGDTHFGMSWNNFLTICEQQGFEVAFRQDFLDNQREKHTEEEVLLIHKEKGLVLYANSYWSKTGVNSAKLYGEVKMKEDIEKYEAYSALNGYSFCNTKYGTQEISLDVREGMIAKLSQLDGKYEFVMPWNELPFVWFLNYMEEKTLSNNIYDREYEKINQKKISLMSPEAQQIIGFSSSKKL